MRRIYAVLIVLFLVVLCGTNASAQGKSLLSAACDVYMDPSPLNRTSGYAEENVVNNNYQGIGQQYNNLNGGITAVKFWARMNPSVSTSNTVKVIVYAVNIGLPGVIIGQTTVTVPNGNTVVPITATFSMPLAVSGNVIIALELFSPSMDNFYVQRNVIPNGQNLNLIKIKQANQWYNNLAMGDPSYDYDFLVLPVTQATVTAGFNSSPSTGTVTFTNTSTGAATYQWDFDDSNTSTATSPVHTYSSSGTYNVKLRAFHADATCYDSVVHAVNVIVSSVPSHTVQLTSGWDYQLFTDRISIRSSDNCVAYLMNILGKEEAKYPLMKNKQTEINTENLRQGIYILHSPGKAAIRFVKN